MEVEQIIQLVRTVSESSLTGFKYEENGMKLHLTKKETTAAGWDFVPVQQPAQAVVQEAAEAPVQTAAGKIVESPLVGTFYAAPSEDAAPFVSVGDTVKKGQTLAIIEAMKLMNEIESEWDGKITEIFVENEQAVEYGQPLFRIE